LARILIDFFIIVGAHTLSLFNTVMLLWLGLTVLLTGDRRRPATIAGGVGLLLGAIFFGGHTLIVTATSSTGIAVVWRVMWIVAVAAPYFWGLTIFYYAGDPAAGRWVRRALTAAALLLILVLFVLSPLPSFYEFIFAPDLKPAVAWAYVPYLFLCFTLPLVALRGRSDAPDRFRRARPWLIGAASMLALAVTAFAFTAYAVIPRAIPLVNFTLDVAREIFVADAVISGFIALAIILLGRAVLANNVLLERVQSSRGFFARWRTVVIIAGAGSFLIIFLYNAPIKPIYGLLLTTVLAVVAYAMFNWRQHVERQEFMNRLRPFVASLHLDDHLLSAGRSDGWGEARDLFTALCRDALQAERASLLFDAPSAAPLLPRGGDGPRRIDYEWQPAHDSILSTPTPDSNDWSRLDADHWAWPLSDSRGAIGRLILGPKLGGSEYTAQELQVAAACAERILDALAGEQLARVALSLLRQRIAEVQVMSAQHKRALHDDLLPQIHLALLRLEALRKKPDDWGSQLDEVAGRLTQTHQRLATMVREMSNAVPTGLESEGLVAALHSALTHDFRDSFDAIDWRANEDATERARRLPLFVGEVLFYAAQEAIRNAAWHARGGDPERKLHLDVAVDGAPGLRIAVSDDGAGRVNGSGAEQSAGSGLLFHSAMLAVVGGTLTVSDRPGGGTQVVIELPQV
jgi:signal transduction histidine kinase